MSIHVDKHMYKYKLWLHSARWLECDSDT